MLIKHFDTINGSYTTTPFTSRFNVYPTITGVKKVYLKSIELSIDFPNIRDGLNTFTIKYNNNLYSINLGNKVYTSISTLISDLNSAYTGVIAGVLVVFSLSGNLINLTLTGITPLTFTIVNTLLSDYVLGFKSSTSSSSGNSYSIIANIPYLLNVDNYLVFNITNLSLNNNNNSDRLCHFKIPLNANNGMVYFENEYSNLTQYSLNTDDKKIIDYLLIDVRDRFGNQLTSYNNDFSFTLGFEN